RRRGCAVDRRWIGVLHCSLVAELEESGALVRSSLFLASASLLHCEYGVRQRNYFRAQPSSPWHPQCSLYGSLYSRPLFISAGHRQHLGSRSKKTWKAGLAF